jgi:hypothetical protein
MGDSDTIAITVNAVNDAPVIAAPASQTMDEDTTLVFSTANGNAISLSDVDAGNAQLLVSLAFTNGAITFATTGGLTFLPGGTSSYMFTGTAAAINAALDGMTFTPASNYNGTASIQISVSDQANAGSGGAKTDGADVPVVVRAVNDGPFNVVPPSPITSEDQNIVFSSANGNQISISDIDAASGQMKVTLTASHGLLTLGSTSNIAFLSGDGSADAAMTIVGTLSDINAALDGLTFAPNHDYDGPATIQVSVDDQANTGIGGAKSDADTLTITVLPVDDAAVVGTSPSQLTYTENAGDVVVDSALTLGDVDNATLQGATVQIRGYVAGQDTLNMANQNGITATWNPITGTLTLSGTASVGDYQAALRSVTYLNTSDNPATTPRTIRFTTSDGALTSAPADRTINIDAVNDAPSIMLPGGLVTSEDQTTSTLLNAYFSDPDDALSSLTLSIVGNSNPALFSSLGIDQGKQSLDYRGAPDASGSADITIRVTDSGGTYAEATVHIVINPVNDPPVIVISGGTVDYPGDHNPMVIDGALHLGDVDNGTLSSATVSIAHYVPGEDLLSFTDQNGITGSFDAATGQLTLSGTASIADYEQALHSVTYTNTSDRPDTTPRDIRITVSDGQNSSATGTRQILIPGLANEPPAPLPPPTVPPVDPVVSPIEIDPVGPPMPDAQAFPPPPPLPISHSYAPPPAPPVPAPFVPGPIATIEPIVIPVPPVPAPIEPTIPDPVVIAPADPVAIVPPDPVAPLETSPIAPAPELVHVAVDNTQLWRQLDALARDLGPQNARPHATAGAVAGLTTTLLSVGYVIWCIRGGSLIATLLTTLPLWRWLDPLPVLDNHERKKDKKRRRKKDKNEKRDEEEENIRTLME